MKRLLYTSCLLLLTELAAGQSKSPQYELYIDTYSCIAIEKMEEYGIPASITLAQGILESGAGQSRLAVEANNHFGIKCHDWTGATIRHDDDALQECFRKYVHAKESFDDHSKFLTTRSRYASLFQLKKTDYKSWAKGLKAAGYATDPKYPDRLIKIIEDYELYKYDTQSCPKSKNTYLTDEKKENIPPKSKQKQKSSDSQNAATDNTQTSNPSTIIVKQGKTIVQSEKIIGQVNPYSTHNVKKNNGVLYVTATPNDTFESIAEEFGLKIREIYNINDANNPSKLEENEIVYIRAKKSVSGTASFHIVESGETMRDIAQRYGIKLSVLLKKNNMQEGVLPLEGQKIILK